MAHNILATFEGIYSTFEYTRRRCNYPGQPVPAVLVERVAL